MTEILRTVYTECMESDQPMTVHQEYLRVSSYKIQLNNPMFSIDEENVD